MPHSKSGLTRDEFDARVTPHLDCLVRCARRVLRSDDLARDAVAETLARLWRRGFVHDDARRTLLGLVFRAALHERRRLLRRARHERGAARDPADDAQCRDPVCELERSELAAALRRAIEDLPPALASTLSARVDDGLEYAAIAERLAIPIGTVRSRLSAARRALAVSLTPRELAGVERH